MLRRAAAALVFLAGVASIALADTPFTRYGSVSATRPCSVRQLTNLPTSLDVVILGSSRMQRGVDPRVVASEGAFDQVYNLARPRRETVRNALIFAELIASGRAPKVLVLEPDIESIRLRTRRGWQWTPTAAGFATWSDIFLRTPRTLNGGTLPDVRIIADGLRDKLQQAILLHTTGATLRALNQPPRRRPQRVCWNPNWNHETALMARRRDRALGLVLERFRRPEIALDRTFRRPIGPRGQAELAMIADIREQARAAGVRLIIVHPHAYAEPPYDPELIAALREEIPELRYPGPQLARRLSRMHADGSHYNVEGRRLFSRWLAGELTAEQITP